MLLDQKSWQTIDGIPTKDILGDFKKAFLDNTVETEVHIGTDSQQAGKWTKYVTVLVVVRKGKGARAWYTKETVPRIRSLRERLMKEVWTSVTLGLELNAHIPETAGLTIDIDANPDPAFKSSAYVKELAAMAAGQGFRAAVKPEAFSASFTADHVVKGEIARAR